MINKGLAFIIGGGTSHLRTILPTETRCFQGKYREYSGFGPLFQITGYNLTCQNSVLLSIRLGPIKNNREKGVQSASI
jgi:hypothetical protein